ncbi:MAG: hypothetical protein IJ716_16000 [Lachnospiraceae bacterium]|nr:hypothetical protein [Lachnospiraceae bacterium]
MNKKPFFIKDFLLRVIVLFLCLIISYVMVLIILRLIFLSVPKRANIYIEMLQAMDRSEAVVFENMKGEYREGYLRILYAPLITIENDSGFRFNGTSYSNEYKLYIENGNLLMPMEDNTNNIEIIMQESATEEDDVKKDSNNGMSGDIVIREDCFYIDANTFTVELNDIIEGREKEDVEYPLQIQGEDVKIYFIDSKGNKIDVDLLSDSHSEKESTDANNPYSAEFIYLQNLSAKINCDEGQFRMHPQDGSFRFRNIQEATLSGTGKVTVSYSPTSQEYEITKQDVYCHSDSDVDRPLVLQIEYGETANVVLYGMADSAAISGFNLLPTFEGWYTDNIYLAPLALITIVFTALGIFYYSIIPKNNVSTSHLTQK